MFDHVVVKHPLKITIINFTQHRHVTLVYLLGITRFGNGMRTVYLSGDIAKDGKPTKKRKPPSL